MGAEPFILYHTRQLRGNAMQCFMILFSDFDFIYARNCILERHGNSCIQA